MFTVNANFVEVLDLYSHTLPRDFTVCANFVADANGASDQFINKDRLFYIIY